MKQGKISGPDRTPTALGVNKYPHDPRLQERESTHGEYGSTAAYAQQLKAVIRQHPGHFSPSQLEALDMMCTKIGRICSGNVNHADHWNDIAGYARLIAIHIEGT